jgi:hypothetical protein
MEVVSMSEQEGSSGTPEAVDSVQAQESQASVSDTQPSQTVSYDTHRRLLGEKKKLQAEYGDMKSRLSELEENQLAGEGKKDELIESLRKRVGEYEKKYKDTVMTYAQTTIQDQVSVVASQMGCIDTSTLVAVAGLETLEPDENFRVNADQVKMLLESEREKRPYLFQKSAPAVSDGTPRNPNSGASDKLDLTKLSVTQRARLFAAQSSPVNERSQKVQEVLAELKAQS